MDMGHQVVVVTAAFHHLLLQPQEPGPRNVEGVNFWLVPTPRYGKGSPGRLLNNLLFGRRLRASAADIANTFGEPDLVIASSPHLFFVGAAHAVARRFDAKFWLEIRDLWPESIVALGLMPARHPLIAALAWQERRAYRQAERLVCLLANAEGYMRSRGLAPGKFIWIPNGVSDQEIQRASLIGSFEHPLVDRIRQLKATGKRVVVYAGGMGPPNAMEVIIDAARVANRTHPDIQFVLIGAGSSLQALKRRAADLPNLEFQDEVDREVVHGVLNAADCAVVSFHDTTLYDYGISPNKLFDYCLFAPRSLIACSAAALTGLEALVSARCEPDDPTAFANAVVSTLAIPPRTTAQRIAAVTPYCYSGLAARYMS